MEKYVFIMQCVLCDSDQIEFQCLFRRICQVLNDRINLFFVQQCLDSFVFVRLSKSIRENSHFRKICTFFYRWLIIALFSLSRFRIPNTNTNGELKRRKKRNRRKKKYEMSWSSQRERRRKKDENIYLFSWSSCAPQFIVIHLCHLCNLRFTHFPMNTVQIALQINYCFWPSLTLPFVTEKERNETARKFRRFYFILTSFLMRHFRPNAEQNKFLAVEKSDVRRVKEKKKTV